MGYLDPAAGNDQVAAGVLRKTMAFEESGAAGVYSASAVLPTHSTVLDIIVNGIALWGAGSAATMIVGDTTDPNGFYDAVNLKATDLLAGESISFALAGGKAGAYIANSQVSPRYSATARTITAQVTTTGTTATTGRTRVTVIYTTDDDRSLEDATYVAS